MRMTGEQWDELVEHARDDAPNECCGLLWGRDGVVEQVERAENKRNSPYGFELTGATLIKANELDDEGYEVAIYHSHPQERRGAVADRHQPGPVPRTGCS